MKPILKPLTEKDYPVVKEIYDYYVVHSTATFHTGKISIKELKESILTGHPVYQSFLIQYQNQTCGYCYLSPFKKRQAYDRTAEVTLYLKPEFTGKGIGRQVLEKMENIARSIGLKVLIGVISGDNNSSIALFEKCGYEKCAHYRQVGEKFGKILDVVAVQKMI